MLFGVNIVRCIIFIGLILLLVSVFCSWFWFMLKVWWWNLFRYSGWNLVVLKVRNSISVLNLDFRCFCVLNVVLILFDFRVFIRYVLYYVL